MQLTSINYKFIVILLSVICYSSYAQDLYVGDDSNVFIFVDGTGFDDSIAGVAPLFVTSSIELDSSVNGEGMIYLRNEAQLLQGANLGNSGRGKISIYQRGTVSATEYNYWCSPVGNTDADNSLNRDFRANVNIYDVTSQPITSSLATFTTGYNGTSNPLVISSFWLFTFDPGIAYNEWDHIGETGNVLPGYGYTMKGTNGSGSNQLYDFRGKANNGIIDTSVQNTDWTLIGNPYPSALDSRDFIHDPFNTNINSSPDLNPITTGALYYWEQDPTPNSHYIAQYIGGYASYTIDATGTTESYAPATFTTFDGNGNIISLPPPGDTGVKVARRYIPVGQGFMIEGAGNGLVRMNNSMRQYIKESSGSSFFFNTDTGNDFTERNTYDDNNLSLVPEDSKRFRLNVDFSDLYTRQLLLNLNPNATEGFNYGLEAKHPQLIDSDAYWNIEDDEYVIQALAYNLTLKVPVNLILSSQQSIRFRIFDVQRFNENQPIFLHDKANNIYVDLRENNYEINLEAGTYEDRFEITFERESLSIDDDVMSDFLIFQDNVNEALTIKNPNLLHVSQVTLYDVSGKQLFNETNLTTTETYKFSTSNFSDGVYLAKVVLDNASTINKKVIVKN